MDMYPTPSLQQLLILQKCRDTLTFYLQISMSQKHIKNQHHFPFSCLYNSNVNVNKNLVLRKRQLRTEKCSQIGEGTQRLLIICDTITDISFSIRGKYKNVNHPFSAYLDLLWISRVIIILLYYIMLIISP